MNKKLINITVALLLLATGSYLAISQNIPINIDGISKLNIERPSHSIILEVQPVASLVKDINHRARIAIFNKEFADRLKNYQTDTQKLNDVYVLAGESYFKNELVGKYPDLSSSVTKLIKSVTGEDNHMLSEEEKSKLSDKFIGLSWALIQKN